MELEGLRGIAILLVTIHHFWPDGQGLYATLAPLAHLGWLGVDLFFVISGLLIGGILLDTRNTAGYFRNFYARRVLRIFPLYYLLVASLFIVVPLAQMHRYDVSYAESAFVRQSGSPLWYLMFAGNIRESLTGVEPAYFLAPLWSISIEEQFYLLSPLLIYQLSSVRLKRTLLYLILISPCFRIAMLWLAPDNERIQYLATVSRLDNLSMGLLLAVMLRTTAMPSATLTRHVLLWSGLLLGVAFALGGLDRNGWFCRVFGYSFIAFFFSVLVYWAVLTRGRREVAFLRARWLMYLGGLCYGLYLLQRPVETLVLSLFESAGIALESQPLLSLLGPTLASVAVAHVSWHVFEKPINRLKSNFKSENHPLQDINIAAPTAERVPLPQET